MSIEEKLKKEFGDIFSPAKFVIEKKYAVASISPIIDTLTGGGIREGTFNILTGAKKLGKTQTSLNIGAAFLEIPSDWGDRDFYIFNIEGRLQPRDLSGINRLLPFIEQDRVHIIESRPGKILTGENYLEIGEMLINEKPGCIFFFDSFSQLCSKARKETDYDKKFRDDMNLFLSHFCKRICNVIPVNKSIVIGITHRIADQGNGPAQWAEASGNKIQYQCDTKLKAVKRSFWNSGDKVIGQDIHWQCEWTPIGTGGGEGIAKFRYNWGLDREAELIDICSSLGLIKKGGAGWYTFNINDEEIKAQGLDKARQVLLSQDGLYEDLNNKFREMMGFA